MTALNTLSPAQDAALPDMLPDMRPDMLDEALLAPPQAPLAMPTQVLEPPSGGLAALLRGLAALPSRRARG